MEAMDHIENRMSRDQQMQIMGMLAELRDKIDRESFRSRINYRTRLGGLSPEHIYEWSGAMIEKLEQMRNLTGL